MTGPHIALISPRGPLYRHNGGIWKKSLRYAPLTLTTLAALIPDALNAEVTLVDEGIEEVDTDLDADLVGISAITGTAPRAYEIADDFRSQDVPVVLGGVHPTLRPEEAMAHADSVVTGYAEETWPQLLHDFMNGGMQRRYDQDPDLDLSSSPRPRRDLLPEGRFTTPHTIEATRGCQHRCDFCVVPSAWGSPMQKPVAEVIDDIRQMDPDTLVFLDLNLLGDIGYAKELFRALIPLDLQWGGLATTLIAQDDELIDLAAAVPDCSSASNPSTPTPSPRRASSSTRSKSTGRWWTGCTTSASPSWAASSSASTTTRPPFSRKPLSS
jgi:hypothetical protein